MQSNLDNFTLKIQNLKAEGLRLINSVLQRANYPLVNNYEGITAEAKAIFKQYVTYEENRSIKDITRHYTNFINIRNKFRLSPVNAANESSNALKMIDSLESEENKLYGPLFNKKFRKSKSRKSKK